VPVPRPIAEIPRSIAPQNAWAISPSGQDLIQCRKSLSEADTEALSHNFDVQIAATRVLEARAQLTISRSARLRPSDAQAGYGNSRLLPLIGSASSLSVSLGWELDLWDDIRNMSVAGAGELLASEQARRAVYNRW